MLLSEENSNKRDLASVEDFIEVVWFGLAWFGLGLDWIGLGGCC